VILPESPMFGDVVVYRERGVNSGPCHLGAFGTAALTAAPTYAKALREAKRLAAIDRVDVWTGFRPRWTDSAAPTFRRVAAHRPAL